eukprot:GILJ01009753.1.p1 GENE.GILJ01009753.1~~GILJ01009753.1.p1  ORF type:complete len:225 (-),score=42.22 GILJ01009753.1:146-820(-)
MTFAKGEHVQWRHRTGTRAGFVEEVFTKPTDVKATGAGRHGKEASETNPGYLITQEKNDEKIFKLDEQLSKVEGDSGKTKEEIVQHDKEIKRQKTGSKRKAADVEPKENLDKKESISQAGKPNRRSGMIPSRRRKSSTAKSRAESHDESEHTEHGEEKPTAAKRRRRRTPMLGRRRKTKKTKSAASSKTKKREEESASANKKQKTHKEAPEHAEDQTQHESVVA